MGYPQTYYTSCQNGLGSSGFQFNAATSGIAGDVMDYLQRLGGYSPPLSAPTTWTPEQLEEFPVALIFAQLSDGRKAVGQSKYIGADYSGRRNGNYFTHFLIIDEHVARSGSFYPIEMWRSATWVTQESPIVEIPPLAEVEFGSTIDLDGIVAFLNEGDKLVYFGQMLSAAVAALDGGRRIIIVDDSDAVAMWIAAMSFALPPELAWKLTFTTYSKEPARVDALVVGTTVDSDFGFTPLEINHTFAVFDFVKRRFSQIAPSPFSSFVTRTFRDGAGAKIGGFGTFVTDSKTEMTPKNLAVAFLAYALVKDFRVSESDEISDVNVCEWCTNNPIVLTEKLTLRLLDRLEAHGLMAQTARDAFHRLYLAIGKARFLPAVQGRFVEMFISQLSKTEIEPLVMIGKDLAENNTPQSDQAQKFAECIVQVLDASNLCLCLRIGNWFGWIDYSEQLQEKIIGHVRMIVAPALSASGMRETTIVALQETCEGAAGTVLFLGIISLLEQHADDTGFFVPLAPLFSNTKVFDIVVRLAREKHYYYLVGRCYADKSAITSSTAAAERYQVVLREMQAVNGDLQPEDYEFAFRLIWDQHPVSAQDSLGLLHYLLKINQRILTATTILFTVSDSLIHRIDPVEEIETLDKEDVTLLGMLYVWACDQQLEILKEHRSRLLALKIRSCITALRSSAEITEVVQKSWKVAETLPPLSRSRLLKAAAIHLINLEDLEIHIKLLQSGVEVFGDDVSEPYAEHIQRSFRRKPDTVAFQRICWVWLRLLKKQKPLDMPSVGDALITAFHGFDKSSRATIENNLESNAALKTIWEEEAYKRATVVSKIKKWIAITARRR